MDDRSPAPSGRDVFLHPRAGNHSNLRLKVSGLQNPPAPLHRHGRHKHNVSKATRRRCSRNARSGHHSGQRANPRTNRRQNQRRKQRRRGRQRAAESAFQKSPSPRQKLTVRFSCQFRGSNRRRLHHPRSPSNRRPSAVSLGWE